ncbi:MAG: PAS domain-containing protein [Chloroflexi bacterium]|nr:PAS domain-containing protein [Chloroflexota bacterium]
MWKKRYARRLSADIWRTIVDNTSIGIVVFDRDDELVYANDQAAELLSYRPQDVLGLDKEDFVSLCANDRLEGSQFNQALLKGDLTGRSFDVVTAERRLKLTLHKLLDGEKPVTVIEMRENNHWRAELIAEAATFELNGPLSFAANYTEALTDRLERGIKHPFELADLTRIIRQGLHRAISLWESFSRLHQTNPTRLAAIEYKAVSLKDTFLHALRELEIRTGEKVTNVTLEIPADLRAIRASSAQLQAALVALIEGCLSRTPPKETITIAASDEKTHIKTVVKLLAEEERVQGAIFDDFPLAITEQLIRQFGGRIWVDSKDKQVKLIFTLPAWESKPNSPSK